jgi:hypothetical protein
MVTVRTVPAEDALETHAVLSDCFTVPGLSAARLAIIGLHRIRAQPVKNSPLLSARDSVSWLPPAQSGLLLVGDLQGLAMFGCSNATSPLMGDEICKGTFLFH